MAEEGIAAGEQRPRRVRARRVRVREVAVFVLAGGGHRSDEDLETGRRTRGAARVVGQFHPDDFEAVGLGAVRGNEEGGKAVRWPPIHSRAGDFPGTGTVS